MRSTGVVWVNYAGSTFTTCRPTQSSGACNVLAQNCKARGFFVTLSTRSPVSRAAFHLTTSPPEH